MAGNPVRTVGAATGMKRIAIWMVPAFSFSISIASSACGMKTDTAAQTCLKDSSHPTCRGLIGDQGAAGKRSHAKRVRALSNVRMEFEARATGLRGDARRIVGASVQARDGLERDVDAELVVATLGRGSRVADLADAHPASLHGSDTARHAS